MVGGGAAGLSAALVLGRARRRVVVIDSGSPRNAPAAHMQGFLSRDGMAPSDLLALGREEVAGYGVAIVAGSAREITSDGASRFRVVLREDRSVHARRLLVATGLRDEIPDVPGLRERWARDVLHCPYCHGFEVRDRKLGVLGRLARGRPVRPDRPPMVRRPRVHRACRQPDRSRAAPVGRPRDRHRRGGSAAGRRQRRPPLRRRA